MKPEAATDPTGVKAALICPLCGGGNACGIASSGRLDADCWCRQQRVARDVLERIPADQRGKVCICPACARGPA